MALLPANQDLTAAEVRLLALPAGREQRLKEALAPIRSGFDVVLIDCPPSLNILTVNALIAADSVLIPMQCEFYALEGLSALVATIEQIRGAANPQLEIEGILRTMYDPRNNLAHRGRRPAARVFRRQGVPHRRAAQRAPGRGALVRAPGARCTTRTRAARWPTSRSPEKCCDGTTWCRREWRHDAEKADPGAWPGRPAGPGAADIRRRAAAQRRRRRRGEQLARLPVELLQRGRYQPRTDVRADTLE